MTSPLLAVQAGVLAALKAAGAVAALVDGRIHDRVPANTVMPYLSFGPSQIVTDDADCIDGHEVFLQLDIWSREPGTVQAAHIGDAVRTALHRRDMQAAGLRFQTEIRFVNFFRDGDGLTSHGVLSIRAFVDITTD